MVRLGRRDPELITPVIKALLKQRTRLRVKGRIEEANTLAEKINKLIKSNIAKRLTNISSSNSKEFWKLVKNTKTARRKS